MSNDSKKEYLIRIRPRYQNASKSEKINMLNEFCNICGYNRKYAIRLLNQKTSTRTRKSSAKRGPKTKYDHSDILNALKRLWKLTNLPCSKRLKPIISLWLPYYPFYLSEQVKPLLLSISPATIDRLMKPTRARFKKPGSATTKPGSILKKHIPVKTNQWDETAPGFLEADSLAHCG